MSIFHCPVTQNSHEKAILQGTLISPFGRAIAWNFSIGTGPKTGAGADPVDNNSISARLRNGYEQVFVFKACPVPV